MKTPLGSKENPLRILIADNWGQDASSFLKRAFPRVAFSVHTKAKSDHPHGHMVAECVCHMLPSDTYAEIVFHPYITLQSQTAANWMNVIADARKAGNPFHLANCSFGSHHRDIDTLRKLLGMKWNSPTKLAEANEKIGDTIVVFASGNEDSSSRFYTDLDNDVNYPQRALSQLANVYVIGACNQIGIPSTFSSDGPEVFAMYLGEDVLVYDPIVKKVVGVDGTSFAAPHACGDIASLLLSQPSISKEWLKAYVLEHAWLAEGWIRGNQHRKAGYGCMLSTMYRREYFRNTYVENLGMMKAKTAYHDFNEIK